ncbi:NarK/NasA family nitrate transporter [Nitrospirales bacterium NOB]|nr:NarK/NasA family nitrate transporter [Nitrospirales bacterium NOB]
MVKSGLRTGHVPTLVGAWLHLTVSFMVWLLFGALAVPIGDALRLTAGQQGLLIALPLLSGALLRIVAGWSCDWYGTKVTGLAVLGLQALAVIWATTGSGSYSELLAIGSLLGAGGASFAVALPVASKAYPPAHQGLVLGLVASGNIGTVLVFWLTPRWAGTLGWQGACGLMLIPLCLTFILFALAVREERPREAAVGGVWWQAAWDLIRQPSVYWLCLVYGITFGGFVGLTSFLPVLLHDQYGSEAVFGGTVAALCGLIGSVIRPFGGRWADRYGGLRLLAGVFLGLALLNTLTGFLPPLGWAVGLLVGTVALLGFGNGVVFQIVSEWFPRDIGLASGLVGAAGGIGGFILPLWFGLLRGSAGTYAIGFAGLALVSVAAALTVCSALRCQARMLGQEADAEVFPIDRRGAKRVS